MTTQTGLSTKEAHQLKRVKAQAIITKIVPTAGFFHSTSKHYLGCSFDSAEECKFARKTISEAGYKTQDAVKNRSRSFYFIINGIKITEDDIPKNKKGDHNFKPEAVPAGSFQSQNYIIGDEKKSHEERLLSRMRHNGIGVKKHNEQLEFYNPDHEVVYTKTVKKFTDGKKLSKASENEISSLLASLKDECALVEDIFFAKWLLRAEGYTCNCTEDLVTKKPTGEEIEPRSTPFIFKKDIEAQKAFKFLTEIGLSVKWQPGTKENFWLTQRTQKKSERKNSQRKRHFLSNALEEMGIMGHKNETGYYYQNAVRTAYCLILTSKQFSEDDRVSFTKETVTKLETLFPTFEFTITKKGLGFHYRDTADPVVTEHEEENSHVVEITADHFLSTFSSEQWQLLLTNAPKVELEKMFPGLLEQKDDASVKALDHIQNNYILIPRDHPMVAAINAMNPGSLVEAKDVKI